MPDQRRKLIEMELINMEPILKQLDRDIAELERQRRYYRRTAIKLLLQLIDEKP